MVIWGRFTNRYFILVPSSEHQFVSLKKCCTSIYTNDTETNQLKLAKPENCSRNAILPEAEYFSNVVLQITDGMENTGGLNMQLFGYLILAWILCFFMVCRGAKDRFKNFLWKILYEIFFIQKSELKKSTGKAAYVTATFPIIILMILVIRGVTLPGAVIGLKYYLTPQWGTLVKAEAGFRIDGALWYLIGWERQLIDIILKTLPRLGWQQLVRFFSPMLFVKDHLLHWDRIINGHSIQWNGLQNWGKCKLFSQHKISYASKYCIFPYDW